MTRRGELTGHSGELTGDPGGLTGDPLGPRRAPQFEEFAKAAGPGLVRFGYVLTGRCADAEDLAQETLVRVGLAWGRVRRGADPTPYARRTLLNLYLNDRRRVRREVLQPDSGVNLPPVAAPEPAPLAAVLALLDRLPPGQRAAIAMRYVLDLADETIADELGCSTSTVRSQVARGLATLRTAPSADATMEGSDGHR